MKRTNSVIAVLGIFLFAQAARADWTSVKRLTWTSGVSAYPAIAVDSSGSIHIVWSDDMPGNKEIYYKKSTDGGATWTTSKRLTWDSANSSAPCVAVDPSDNLHVAWMDGRISLYYDTLYYKKSTDGGATWSANKRLTWGETQAGLPKIAVDASGGLHVVWGNHDYPESNEIYHRKSTDGGASWTASQNISQTSWDSHNPAVAVDNLDRLHVVWQEEPPEEEPFEFDEIYYARSAKGASAWSTSQNISLTDGISDRPDIAVDHSGRIHVVWDESLNNTEICYLRSVDGGVDWSTSRRLSWLEGKSFAPKIAVDSLNHLHVLWFEETSGDIYYKKSIYGGVAWTSAQRITWTSGGSYSPAVCIDSSDTVHVVWHDDTPGNYEIYYKNGK